MPDHHLIAVVRRVLIAATLVFAFIVVTLTTVGLAAANNPAMWAPTDCLAAAAALVCGTCAYLLTSPRH